MGNSSSRSFIDRYYRLLINLNHVVMENGTPLGIMMIVNHGVMDNRDLLSIMAVYFNFEFCVVL